MLGTAAIDALFYLPGGEPPRRYYEAHAQLALAGALLATDGVVPRAEIESALERADRLVESIAGRSLSPRILELRGRLAAALGATYARYSATP